MRRRQILLRLCAAVLCAWSSIAAAADPAIPALRKNGEAIQLFVDGSPFLILGGELANSSASSLDYMAPVWPKLRDLHLNTVLAPVSWELIEPEEGRFDFHIVDGLLNQARAQDMRIVLLWFGSWKNSMSSYAPAWVKRDSQRFPRARTSDGKPLEILSPFAPVNAAADARAFAALMRHLREVDAEQRTVIMVQVENEIGMIPEARDHLPAAESAYRSAVPEPLLRALRPGAGTAAAEAWRVNGSRQGGSWEQMFGAGEGTEEMFMAWHFARYTEQVAAAGKAAYPLPLFVNAALPRPGKAPGDYPSAGPLPHLRDIWGAAAPSIDLLAPDIYYPNFSAWTDAYAWPGNPLFIPEANRAGAAEASANALYAVGKHRGLGFSPFSIDSIGDPSAEPLGRTYAVLQEMAPLILDLQAKGKIAGWRPTVAFDGSVSDTPAMLRLGRNQLTLTPLDPWTPKEQQRVADHGALILQLDTDEYLIVGSGVTVTFAAADGSNDSVGIESIWEGRFAQGKWLSGRLLNGDQSHQGRHLRLAPGPIDVQRVHLYRYR